MKTLLSEQDANDLKKRLEVFTDKSKRKWGVMTPQETVQHLRKPLLVALGEKHISFRPSIFSLPIIKTLASQYIPWPHNAPSAPEFLEYENYYLTFNEEKRSLIYTMDCFITAAIKPENSFPPHPVFGWLTRRQWARLMWRHIDHHLRQFGV